MAEHRAALYSFDQAALAPSGADGSAPAAGACSAGPPAVLTAPQVPSWHEVQQRISFLCRTGPSLEEAMRQASSEAASPWGLREGPGEDLELEDGHSDVSDFEDDDDDDVVFERYASGAGSEATFTRTQIRDMLAKQMGPS